MAPVEETNKIFAPAHGVGRGTAWAGGGPLSGNWIGRKFRVKATLLERVRPSEPGNDPAAMSCSSTGLDVQCD
jgi:hypothetical protein